MTIAKAALKVIQPKRKWDVELVVAGVRQRVTVSAREWSEVLVVLDATIADKWQVLSAA